MDILFYWTDQAYVAVFAIAGTLLHSVHDGFGVITASTAIGGGTVRDLILAFRYSGPTTRPTSTPSWLQPY